jgi:hypothetical protein
MLRESIEFQDLVEESDQKIRQKGFRRGSQMDLAAFHMTWCLRKLGDVETSLVVEEQLCIQGMVEAPT